MTKNRDTIKAAIYLAFAKFGNASKIPMGWFRRSAELPQSVADRIDAVLLLMPKAKPERVFRVVSEEKI